ncbi:MAG: hypothetical protein ACLQBB_03140 [Solirubrobacteraceae bacterium]
MVVTAPRVATVAFSDGRRVRTRSDSELPYGMRIALLLTPNRAGTLQDRVEARAAYDSSGRRIRESSIQGSELQWRIWHPPARPARGACALRLTGGYPASTEGGQVAATLRPYPAQIAGRAFLSCIDTAYYVPGRGMRASVLLDAQHPGQVAPAPIPGLSPVPGVPGLFNTTRNYGFESLSARREGDAWIVVADGGRNAEDDRIRLLRHLRIHIAS